MPSIHKTPSHTGISGIFAQGEAAASSQAPSTQPSSVLSQIPTLACGILTGKIWP